jgi:hypothetical protein
MKTVTVSQVLSWHPCGWDGPDDGVNYTRQRLERLADGRTELAPREVAALDIPAQDKAWLLLRNHFLTDEQMHLLACDFAEEVVHLRGDDPRPQAAIDAKRAWVRGEITDDELDAARHAAWRATRDTSRHAAWYAAWRAAWYAASAATWHTQIEMILEAIEDE